jgi:beta-lactamase regulating signal transducer with metallopeptidase domain
MHPLLEAGLANAAAATVLALVAAAVGRVTRRPALAHALWLLVLLKLLTPPLIAVPVGWLPADTGAEAASGLTREPRIGEPPGWSRWDEPAGSLVVTPPASVRVTERETTFPHAHAEPVPRLENPDVDSFPAAQALPPASHPAKALSSPAPFPWRTITIVWLVGSLIWFAVAGFSIVRFRRLLRYAPPASEKLRRQAADLACRLGLARCPEIRLVPGAVSPLLWAFGRPRLVLPQELFGRLSAEQRATLLAHELAHLRRREHWVRVLELVACGLYWWHPVV